LADRATVAALLSAALLLGSRPAFAQPRQLELGVEGFGYQTRASPVNRDDVAGLDRYPGLARLALGWKESHGGFKAVFRGYVERTWGRREDDTSWVVRQGYAQWWRGEAFGLRLGKQRIAWGSGLAWNPTNRLEPPKNALNPSLEQEGALAARLDWAPWAWLSFVAVAATTDAQPRDLPVAAGESEARRTLALRTRFLVRDADLALVFSAGKNQQPLLGLDLGRDLAGVATLHLEAAVYEGAEMFPPREGQTFLRLVAGALRTSGDSALALEYFYNGEGYSDAGVEAWLVGLDRSWTAATNPALPPALQQQALAAYAAGASIPYAWGLGLRRNYLHASWARSGAASTWTGALRLVVGLDDGGLALTPGVGYAPRGNLTLNLDAVLLLGPGTSEYGLAPVKGALQGRVRLLF
jgi:hypothetical protein